MLNNEVRDLSVGLTYGPLLPDISIKAYRKEDVDAGVKYDADKPRWDLVPWDAVKEIVWILTFGAKKYKPRNWEKGMDWSRLGRAAIGHITDWMMGENKDPESGKSHLAHAGCCILFLIAYELRGIGNDNRKG